MLFIVQLDGSVFGLMARHCGRLRAEVLPHDRDLLVLLSTVSLFLKSSYRARRFIHLGAQSAFTSFMDVTEGYEKRAQASRKVREELARAKRQHGLRSRRSS